MMNLSTKIKLILSDKRISFTVILLTVISRLIQLIFFYNIRVDASYQVMATQNLIYGHGISTANVPPNDLSAVIYTPLINWPPGYSLLLAPFYILFYPNYIAAGLLLDSLAAITLIFITRAILKLFDTPVYLINISTILIGIFVYYFYFIACSDAIAISVYMLAFYNTLALLKTGRKWKRRLCIICISLLTCAYIKYLFIPVAFIIPIFLFLKGLADRNRWLQKGGMILGLGLFVGIGLLLGYQKMISGSATYISQPERGFYPQHLLDMYPFVIGSFLKPDTLVMLLNLRSSESLIVRCYQILQGLLFLLAAGYLLQHLWRNRLTITLTQSYFYLLFFISLTVSLLLSVLSLTVAKEEILPGWFWTYVEEPRYYGLPNVLLHLGIFISYQFYKAKPLKYLKYAYAALLLLLLPEIFRDIIFDINRIRLLGKEEYSWQYEDRFQKYAASIICKEQLTTPGEKTVVTGTSYYMNHRVSLYSHAPILSNVNAINSLPSLNTKKPVLLVVILQENELKNFQPFLAWKGKEAVGKFDGFYFYTFHIRPH